MNKNRLRLLPIQENDDTKKKIGIRIAVGILFLAAIATYGAVNHNEENKCVGIVQRKDHWTCYDMSLERRVIIFAGTLQVEDFEDYSHEVHLWELNK